MNESGTGGVGSIAVQALQLLTLSACLYVGKFGKATLRDSVDVWVVGAVYFGTVSFFLAEFFAENERFVEITYAARFIMWFLFAAIVARGTFELRQLEKLSGSFLIGTFIQGMLAVWAFKTQHVGSIYSEVYATTGGAYVSGKMIVSFVTLGIFLAFYWYVTRIRYRWIYAVSIFVGLLVILFSYNRATQLSLALVVFGDAFWLFLNKRVKAMALLVLAALIVGLFLTSSLGDSFLLRWQNIQEDGGSGRVKLVRAAIEDLTNPESMTTLMFGKGYHQTKLLMFQACGAYIGTHSDLFDFLMVYGLVGGGFYAWIVLKILTMGRGLSNRSLEFLCIRSAGAFIVMAGLVTGMFQGTYTFFMLFTICRYWYEAGRRREFETSRVPWNIERFQYPGHIDYFPNENDASEWEEEETPWENEITEEEPETVESENLIDGMGNTQKEPSSYREPESVETIKEKASLDLSSLTLDSQCAVEDNTVETRIEDEAKDGSYEETESQNDFEEETRYLDAFFGQLGMNVDGSSDDIRFDK